MFEQMDQYKPKYLAEDMILSAELRERGSKFASKRLAKEKKGIYKTGTPAECSYWWDRSKKGKKKDKMAMVIMASLHDFLLELLDVREGKVLELGAKTKSQTEEIKLLKLKLQQRDNKKNKELQLEVQIKSQEGEIKQLQQELLQWKVNYEQLNCELSRLESKADSQKKEMTLLKQIVQKQEEENEHLKDEIAKYNTSGDDSKNPLRLPVPVPYNTSRQKPLFSLLEELPDLQYDNSNHEFWFKIKRWLIKGEVDPKGVFMLVRSKCPPKAWQKIVQNADNRDLTEMAFSNPATMVRQKLEKLWKCLSEALGLGTNSFEKYYFRRQQDDERFEEYFQEKFRLYCSYGVEHMEPDRNDRHFLYNVIEKASKRYQDFINPLSLCPKSYTDLLNQAMVIDSMITAAEWNNVCLNCKRQGHTKTQCRRPGGDAEVGPNVCFTCGGYGHLCRDCWTYKY